MCPVCGSDRGVEHDDLSHCSACDHVFQTSLTAHVRYGADYLETYRSYPTHAMACVRLGYLKAHVGGGTLLDVGHGTGDLVRLARQAGFDAYGSDVHGVDVGVPEKPLDGDDDWDVVTFYDSLEHFEDFGPVRRLAARARLIVVSLPHRPEGFPAERSWKHYKPGEHLHYFSPASIAALFDGRRLERVSDVEDVVRRPVGGRPNIMTATFR